MPLHCVCGRAGSGKSRYIARAIGKAIQSGRKAFLIVPDQFTLDAEHLLMDRLGAPGLMQAEVLSFSRLCARILENCGQPKGPVLDARGRAMMVSRLLVDHQQSLNAYTKYVHAPHFSATLAGQIAEFKRFDITAQQLFGLSENHARLHDIALIYDAYQSYMRNVYTDNEDRINWMIEHIPHTPFLQGASIFIDEFEMLTSQIYRTVSTLIRTAHDVCATFRICPKGDADAPLFSLEQKHLDRMRSVTQQAGHAFDTVWLPDGAIEPRHRAHSALSHLERSLFVQPPLPFTGDTADVSLHTAPSMYRECMDCARRIITLVRDEGYRFQDIAVAAADLSDYGPLLQQAFIQFGIPSFLDVKRSVGTHPLSRYALLSLRVLISNFAVRDVLSLVKTGLSNLTIEESDALEESIITSGIRYLSESTIAYYGEICPNLSAFRHTLLCAHDALRDQLRNATNAKEQADAFLSFLEADGCVLRLNELLDELEEQNDADGAMELRQVYEVLCSLLMQMRAVMDDVRMSLRGFYDHLAAGLYAEEVGVLPAYRDAVHVGTVGRSRSGSIRTLFVLGFNEGLIPRVAGDSGLLTREDQRLLSDASLFMGNAPNERATEERLMVYALLTKPSDRLVLSYAQSDLSGKQLLPSSLLHALQTCLPALTEEMSQHNAYVDIQTPSSTLLPLANAIRQSRLMHKPLIQPYQQALDRLLPLLSDAQQRWFTQSLPEEQDIGSVLAEAAYHNVSSGSATALERMAHCPFRHFVDHALLQPKPVVPYGHTRRSEGLYFHAVADLYLRELNKLNIPLDSFDKAQSDALLDQICSNYDENAYLIGPYRNDARERHLVHWHRIRLKNDCWQIKRQLEVDGFMPVAVESGFVRNIELPDGRSAKVQGYIDRVDVAQKNGQRLVRVVDYKTGSADFSYTELYYGTSLQLPLYADIAAKQLDGRSVGMFIQHLRNSVSGEDPDKVDHLRAQQARLRGAYTADCADTVGEKANNILADFKNGPLSDDAFDAALHHGQSCAQALMQQRVDGTVRPYPLQGEIKSCEYCPYSAACGFDVNRGQGRRSVKLGREEFLSLVTDTREDLP